MPYTLELPRVRRAVVPLMRSGYAVVDELVVHGLPRLAAIVGTLHQLSEPAAALGRVNPIWISRRSLQVVHLPTCKERPADVPLLAFAIGREDKCALLRANEY